jgi:hypothetical protein
MSAAREPREPRTYRLSVYRTKASWAWRVYEVEAGTSRLDRRAYGTAAWRWLAIVLANVTVRVVARRDRSRDYEKEVRL